MPKPKISVIMPVYNTEKYIGEAIESILDQTFTNFEFIIIDDGSTDKSWEIIQKYAKKDKRIKALQNKENLKICKTLNKGLEYAKGEYIARMDADDIAFKKRLEKQLQYIEHNDIDIVGGNIIFIDERGKEFGKRSYPITFFPKILIESPCAHPNTIFKKKMIEKIGGYKEKFIYAEDYDLRLRAYGVGYKGGNIQEDTLYYRISLQGTKATRVKKQILQTIKVKENAIKKGYIKMNMTGKLRLKGEKIMYYFIPGKIILWLFKLIKG